jgi:hypothetical protein
VVVRPAPVSITAAAPACMRLRTRPRAASPVAFVGNARDGAPILGIIIVVIISTLGDWNCKLSPLAGWAAMMGGRRSTQLGLLVLTGFFSVVEIMVVDFALTVEPTVATLRPRFPSAPSPLGQLRPLDGAPPHARTVAHPAGRSPLGEGQGAGAFSTWTTAASSPATRTSSSWASRGAMMSARGPISSAGAVLFVPFPLRALRAGTVRLPAHGIIGAACVTALARASSQTGGRGGGSRSGGRRPKEAGDGPGTKDAGDRGPDADGALLPRTLLSSKLIGRSATPLPAGGVGVADRPFCTTSATTPTPRARRGVGT